MNEFCILLTSQCNYDDHAWWGVDLDGTFEIYNVVLTTRSDSASYQKDMKIMTTNIKGPIPSGYNLDHHGYDLCAQYDGTPPLSQVLDFKCE